MAFITKTKGGTYQVRQGNNNVILSTFRGKDAKKKAEARVRQLHKTHRPSGSNRGKSARKRFK